MKSERDVKKKVKALLDKHLWFFWMTPASAYGKSGISDFSALRAGVFLAIETKFGSNKPTALQLAYLNSVRAEDGFGFVVSDRNLDWFQSWLEAFDRSVEASSKGEKVTAEDGAAMINAMREMA